MDPTGPSNIRQGRRGNGGRSEEMVQESGRGKPAADSVGRTNRTKIKEKKASVMTLSSVPSGEGGIEKKYLPKEEGLDKHSWYPRASFTLNGRTGQVHCKDGDAKIIPDKE